MFFTFTKVNECLSYNKVKKMENNIKHIKNEIKSLEDSENKSDDEVKKLKESKKEDIRMLEVWEKELEKMEKNL